MAKKKQEIQLLREIESQEEWEEVMGKEGLWVVDVYQEWSGHCDAMTSNFRRIKNELGDPLLHFAMAKADNIESLEKYRGSCEPCFLFYGTGVLVSFVHGANAPLILRTLTEQLAQEHKVVDGNAERKEVKDPFVANREVAEETLKEEEEEDDTEDQKFQYNEELVMYGDELTPAQDVVEVEQGYTVALIKPNVVEDGKVDEVLAEMKAKGIDVIAQEERQLTEEEAKEFYSHLAGEEYFDDLVSFMTSGPSHVLVLTKGQEDDAIIKDWRDMLGPPTVEDAKEQSPECLRAKFGKGGLLNALHGSDSKETAARELAFFFPTMDAPKMQKKKKEVERTLALIRPEAFAQNKDAIMTRIKEAGFHVALQKEVMLTKEQAEEFYKEHDGQPYFDELTTRMSSGPLMALGLAREDAISKWREMLGPKEVAEAKETAPDSLRAQFATAEEGMNEIHGSDNQEAASKELDFFFPMEQTVAMIKPDGIETKDAIINKIHEAGFRIAARKETTITKEIAESFYEDQKDKDYFNDLVEHMISGPTMFMVLSREGAVDGWRQEIGPTDPETAKEEAPTSLRAQFGSDKLKNAVHGASNQDEAKKKIQEIFGDMTFNADGTVKEIQQEPEEQVQAEQETGGEGEQPQTEQAPTEGEGQAEEKPAEGEAAGQDRNVNSQDTREHEAAADQAEQQEAATAAKTEEAPQEAAEQKDETPEAGDQNPNTAKEEEEAAVEQKDKAPATAEQKEDAPAAEVKQEETQETKGEEEEKKGDEGEGKGQAEEGKKEEGESKGEQKEEQKEEAAAAEEKKGEEEVKTEA